MAAAGYDYDISTKWTKEIKIYCVGKYMEVMSYKKIIAETMTRFPQHKPPYKSLIFKWVIKYIGVMGLWKTLTERHLTTRDTLDAK